MSDIQLFNADCLEKMKDIPDNSIDLILTDPPYGTTSSKWDKEIPFSLMWNEIKRIIKSKSAIVLFGAEPFTSKLILSNIEMFKYNWYWNKSCNAGFVNAKLKPMNTIETISIFSKGTTANNKNNEETNMHYFPQGLIKCNKVRTMGNKAKQDNTYARPSNIGNYFKQEWTNYPRNYLEFQREGKCVHPCQKPITILEYLIKTYTLENETVLDFTMGSGSTGVAAVNLNRKFIGIELNTEYFEIAKKRIADAENQKKTMLDFGEVV